jgi:hypothetical protein
VNKYIPCRKAYVPDESWGMETERKKLVGEFDNLTTGVETVVVQPGRRVWIIHDHEVIAGSVQFISKIVISPNLKYI